MFTVTLLQLLPFDREWKHVIICSDRCIFDTGFARLGFFKFGASLVCSLVDVFGAAAAAASLSEKISRCIGIV